MNELDKAIERLDRWLNRLKWAVIFLAISVGLLACVTILTRK